MEERDGFIEAGGGGAGGGGGMEEGVLGGICVPSHLMLFAGS